MFGRMLLGYYSTVVNNIQVSPEQIDDIDTAAILNDLVDYIFRTNNFNAEGDKIKLDLILTGLMCCYIEVKETGEYDEFKRPKYKINISHVPSMEIIPDPMSALEDYSDARFIHRYRWVSREKVVEMFGKSKLKMLNSYDNHLREEDTEFVGKYHAEFVGEYKVYDNYLIVHSILTDEEGKSWSVYWSGETILDKKEITYRKVKNPYRLHKLNVSHKAEYYGIFREVRATQHAINQAILKIQLMVNTQKAFVEENAIDNIENFTDQFNRVNAVIKVKDLSGIKIENLTREVLDQYTIIDKALDRVQRLLSINDSFLGMAYASDSGAKVKLQQNASVVALRYATSKMEQFYRLLGWDILNLIQQYFTAHDVVRIADTFEGQRWVEINKPLMLPTGRVDEYGQPEMRYEFEEVIDPATNKPLIDKEGNYILAPIPTMETEIAFTKADISVDSVAYDDEDEKNQAVLDSVLNGPMGNLLSQVNPAGYFKLGSLAVKNLKNKYSLEMASVIDETAQMLSPQQAQAMQNGQLDGQTGPKQAMNKAGGY
jgi:hypothetical protein